MVTPKRKAAQICNRTNEAAFCRSWKLMGKWSWKMKEKMSVFFVYFVLFFLSISSNVDGLLCSMILWNNAWFPYRLHIRIAIWFACSVVNKDPSSYIELAQSHLAFLFMNMRSCRKYNFLSLFHADLLISMRWEWRYSPHHDECWRALFSGRKEANVSISVCRSGWCHII